MKRLAAEDELLSQWIDEALTGTDRGVALTKSHKANSETVDNRTPFNEGRSIFSVEFFLICQAYLLSVSLTVSMKAFGLITR